MPINPTVTAEYEHLVERDYRRNLLAIVSWEFLWGLGLPFAMFATFIPAYLGALNAPKALIGFILSFPPIFAAGQILMSYLIPAKKRLVIYRLIITGASVPWLAYSGAAFFWGTTWPPWFHFAAFTLVQILFIGTKKQAQESIKLEAQRCQAAYVSERWLGGGLTNFETVKKSIARLREIPPHR